MSDCDGNRHVFTLPDAVVVSFPCKCGAMVANGGGPHRRYTYAVAVGATTPPHPVKGEGASVSQGSDDG